MKKGYSRLRDKHRGVSSKLNDSLNVLDHVGSCRYNFIPIEPKSCYCMLSIVNDNEFSDITFTHT